ncbi:hypothetical protein [Mycobacterium phage Weirdo19]|uniref:HNH endonuclease n=1 Tax=Mycobacterium phage Weirdo19 TaxID=2601610 RepID=A0A6M2YSZ4_9CAUD|nr:hypothetical protein KDJ11_gp88 [Mycobacterium phage Weirdo19]QEA10856.1 hypothetical protein [Mycobacterium phage Weirdo19]
MTTTTTPIPFRAIARSIRFRHHPTLTACWVWTGPFHPVTGGPRISTTGHSARQDVFERITGTRPEGNLRPTCGTPECVNPHHMHGKRTANQRTR